MAFILRNVKLLFNCCCVRIHNVLRGCASYLPPFNLNRIQFGTTTTIEKQIAGSNAKKGQPKGNMGRKDKKKKSAVAKTANVSPTKQQIGVKRPPASPPEPVSPKRMSPPISTAAFETSSESPTTSTQESKQTTEQNELQQQDGPNDSLTAGDMKDVEAKPSESSAEHVQPEIFSSEPPSTESSLRKRRRGRGKGRNDSQETDEVNSKPSVEKQHEPQQTKQEATPEPKLKESPTKKKPGGEQSNDRQPKQGGRKDNEPEQRHHKDKDVRGDSSDKAPNQPNKQNKDVQQLERKASIPDSTLDNVAQLELKPIETSPKKPTFKQPNATTPEKMTPKSKKQTPPKHRQEAKDVAINSTFLDDLLHSPEKSKSAEKGKLEDEQSLRQEEVKVENVSLQKRDQTQTTKTSSREKSDERPPREKSSDRPSKEKSNDKSSKEKSNDGTSPKTSKGQHSAKHGNENRNISNEKQPTPSQQTKAQRDDGQGKEQKPPKDEGNWDDGDRQMNMEDDGEWHRGGRDRKHDQHRDPEKEYGNQQDQDDYREQGRRGGARGGRGRDGNDRPQHDRGFGRGRLQGRGRGGNQNNWRDDRGGEREFRQADWMGGYDGNQRGNRGGQRGNRGGQRGGRAVIPEVPLKQPNELPSFIREVEDNLFSCENHVSLAHCVSADFEMGKGIAVEFKKRFRGVQELYAQGKGPGDVAFLKRDIRYVYYMVTKSDYYKKPSYESMRSSLIALKTHVQQHKVTELAMPRIGSGLDRLDWNIVLDMIVEVFEGSNVDITVYVYKPPRK